MIPQLHSNARAKQCTYHNSFDTRELRLELMEHEEAAARGRLAHALHGRVESRVYTKTIKDDRRVTEALNGGPMASADEPPAPAPPPAAASPRKRRLSSPPVCNILRPNIDTNIINSTSHQTKIITQVVIEGSDSRRVPSPTVVTKFIDKNIVESRNLFLRTAGKVKPYLVVTEKTNTPRGNGRPPELPELPHQPVQRGVTPGALAKNTARLASPPVTPRTIPSTDSPQRSDLQLSLKTRNARLSPPRTPRPPLERMTPADTKKKIAGVPQPSPRAVPAVVVLPCAAPGPPTQQLLRVSETANQVWAL